MSALPTFGVGPVCIAGGGAHERITVTGPANIVLVASFLGIHKHPKSCHITFIMIHSYKSLIIVTRGAYG